MFKIISIGVAALVASPLCTAQNNEQLVGFTAGGEEIRDCLLPANRLNSDLGPQTMVVKAKRLHFSVAGQIEFDKRGSAIFKPTKVVLPDGAIPDYKMSPLVFLGEPRDKDTFVVEAGSQCGIPVTNKN